MPTAAASPCLICGSTAAVSLLEEARGYSILFCGECRLRFSHPMSHPGQAFYEDSQLYDNRDMGRVSLSLPRLEWRCQAFFGRARPRSGTRMLDLGCGDGGLLEVAASRGMEPYGLELDRRAVQIARAARGLKRVEQGPFEKAVELGWKDFDYVTCMDVMEHVPDPAWLAGFIRGLLRPGGTAAISVPSWDRRPAWFDPETDYPPHHFTLWTREALTKLLRKTGFENVEVLEAPVTFQNFLYAALSRLKAKRQQASPADPKAAAPRAPASSAGERPAIRLDRKRILAKTALYRAFNLVNPLLRVPPFKGHTLMILARKPA